MKKSAIFLFLQALGWLLYFSSCTGFGGPGHPRSVGDPDSGDLRLLYDTLDIEMGREADYCRVKEMRIATLRNELAFGDDQRRRARLADELAREFESYNSDSALYYVNLNLQSAYVQSDPRRMTELLIQKADITSHAGLFPEALAILGGIDRRAVEADTALLESYYSVYCGIYQYQSEYTLDSEYQREYERLRALYTDSVVGVCKPGSFNKIVNEAPAIARSGDTATARRMLLDELRRHRSGTREYSIVASILAYIYSLEGDVLNQKRYLAMSATSDIRAAVKENTAMRQLATLMFEDGDIIHANRYLKQSFADANFFSARMRNAQSGRMLPIIDEAYNSRQQALQQGQRWLLIAISVLAAVLVVSLLMVRRQYREARKAHAEARESNRELQLLSQKLHEANASLAETNERMRQSNIVKEEYAGRFMEYCSSAISTLQHYHQGLRVLASQGSRAALERKLESSEMIDAALKDFYTHFDEAIIEIYPQFVEKFNLLLKPESRVVLKPGEVLNTELRVFALIRIGIDDSEKISRFLRCSITTVYTYRSKMRRRALRPDTFEEEVKTV